VFEAPQTSAEAARPITGGTLLALPDARTAIAADPDRDRIFVADYAAQTVLADLPLQPGDEPGRLVADDQGRVHVALRAGGAVVTLVPNPWRIAARRPVCAAPRGIAFEGTTSLLHVACAEGVLVSLPADPAGAPTRRLSLPDDLRDVVVDGDVLLVSRFRSAEVLTIGADGKLLGRSSPPARRTQRFNLDPSTGAGNPSEATMTASVAWKMVALRPGQTLMLHQRALADEVQVGQPGGYGGQCAGIVESAVSAVNPLDARPWAAPALPGTLVVDLAVSPDGQTFAAVAPGERRLGPGNQLIEMSTGDPYVDGTGTCRGQGAGGGTGAAGGRSGGAGTGGDAVPDAGDGSGGSDGGPAVDEVPPPVPARQPIGEATAVAYDRRGHILVQTREPAALEVLTAPRRVIFTRDSRLDSGHAVFHADSGSGVACASCHPEGGDDGRIWKFRDAHGNVEVRRTQNLRGKISGTAPFHWNGDLPTMSTLMSEVFERRMSGPTLESPMVGALSTWIDTIPALPRRPAADPAAVERGRATFQSPAVGCATCHTGALLTNNSTVDVGTGRALQVPSLRGLAWRAPFMHDGCAPDLARRFDARCGGGDRHGFTGKLSPAELADLAAYLGSL
jgi:mono/diheme cytochrome c family protein